jgi:hypothetical protein
MRDERSRDALVVAERYANGEARDKERAAAWDAARAALAALAAARAAAWDARAAAWAAADAAAEAAAWDAAWDAARAAQTAHFIEICNATEERAP